MSKRIINNAFFLPKSRKYLAYSINHTFFPYNCSRRYRFYSSDKMSDLPDLPSVSNEITSSVIDSVETNLNNLHIFSNPNPVPFPEESEIPPGFLYVEDFLTEEEQKRAIDIINSHEFSQMIHRRQQFYGKVYYHTPQSPRATLQPVDIDLATKVQGNHDTVEDDNKVSVPEHDLDPLQWVIDKLIAKGLFERADAVDPMVEYVKSENNTLEKVERKRGAGKYMDESEERHALRLKYLQNQGLTDAGGEGGGMHFAPLRQFPDQILVNEYTVRQNIGTHYDDALAFGPLIVGVSLVGDCTLTLSVPQCMGRADAQLREAADIEDIIPSDGLKEKSGKKTETPDFPYFSDKNEKLSYLMSIRDFSRPDWGEGPGPSILSEHCRCTREAYILENHPEQKTFLNSDNEGNMKPKPKVKKSWGSEHPEKLRRMGLVVEEKEEEVPEVDDIDTAKKKIDDYLFNYEYPPQTNLLPTLAHVNTCPHSYKKVHVPVKAGSVYVLAGASRYLYRHGIKKLSRSDIKKYPDYQRLSMTVRSLYPGRRQVLKDSEVDTSNCKYKYNENTQQ